MYEELVKRLREHGEFLIVSDRTKAPPNVNVRNVFAEDYAQAADAIEELSKLADAIPHVCECCVGCELEKENGGCDHAFILSPKRTNEYLSKPRWIPVTDRLPKPFDRVIVCDMRWGVLSAMKGEDDSWGGRNDIVIEKVTHWMPLPEPPKEEKENDKTDM